MNSNQSIHRLTSIGLNCILVTIPPNFYQFFVCCDCWLVFNCIPVRSKSVNSLSCLDFNACFCFGRNCSSSFFPVSLSTPRYTLDRYTIVPFFFLYSVIFMVYSFSISRQADRLSFEFIPCEGLREPPYFRF